jgi:hypothetical protein
MSLTEERLTPLFTFTAPKVVILIVLLGVVPGIVASMKGRWAYLIAGIVLSPAAWWVATLRLARPTSFWARHFYGWHKMERASHRFGSEALPEEQERLLQRPRLHRIFNVDPEDVDERTG